MNILHTADWHLGKVLHGQDLEADHRLFFKWLYGIIIDHHIKVLLVSGDIFDQSNPTNEARRLYFEVLTELYRLGTKIIITGGNHDSIQMLNASNQLLNVLNITVLGGMSTELEDHIIEIRDEQDILKCIVAAIPYLRDKDVRNFIPGESSSDRIKAMKDGILNQFVKIKNQIIEKYKSDFPIIGMGHLYIQGATLSEGEKDIQIGNVAGIDVKNFDGLFDYLALGHIHIPKRYSKNTRYSGSPIPLSFSEKDDEKKVILISINGNDVTSKSITIPKFREMHLFSGNFEDVYKKLLHSSTEFPLPSLYELHIDTNRSKIPSIEQDISNLKETGYLIQKVKYNTPKGEGLANPFYEKQLKIAEINPIEVFYKKIENDGFTEEEKVLLQEAYTLLLEEIQNED